MIEDNNTPALPTDGTVPADTAQTLSAAVSLPETSLQEWKVSGIFTSHMVLQRDTPITVWGFSSHIGAAVEGEWYGERVFGTVGEDGRFSLVFSAHPADSVPSCMTVSSEYGVTVFDDILVGDVFVIGGQSNAELSLAPCLADTPDIAEQLSAEHPIRLFRQTQAGAAAKKEFHHIPSPDIIYPDWTWQTASPESAKAFSAIGYYLAHILQPVIGVPVGVVMMCAGGACLRELMPVSLAHRLGYHAGANVPIGGYYNTLISPLIGLRFRAQVFFQGESEGIWLEMADAYDDDLAAFVADERARFGFNFPFYNIQLSSYREEGAKFFPHLSLVRASQLDALEKIPNSHLTVARDLGSDDGYPDFAHSPHKYELSCRLAAQILASEYGIGDIGAAVSPHPISARYDENGGAVLVTFANVHGGLCTQDGSALVGFSFPDGNRGEIPAKAEILSSDTVRVEIPAGAMTKTVHFAMGNIADTRAANLAGGNQNSLAHPLPVPSFILRVDENAD
ncbi:MAG: hypothetical protein IJ449_02445 [Clostridia bacterium]|nr:hypothetical protein [Clostridia bacterium]